MHCGLSKPWTSTVFITQKQPVTATDIDGLKSIKSRTSVPIAADASAESVDEAYNVIKEGAADVFHALMGRIGGIRKSLQFTNLVDAANLDYAICVLGTASNTLRAPILPCRASNGKNP